ncbi:MAG: hypothetical protein Q7J31_11380 [Syntrophales bacterium]|nr:hypothetical protein [Syntrophales bacterium]
MLSIKLENVAIIVVADSNNPRLLNPDFLDRNNIVPKEWKVKDALVTPPFAQVSYENGVRVLLEENRLHVMSQQPDMIPWERALPGVVTSFIEVLHHVSYRSVGLNFVFLSDQPKGVEAEQALMGTFLKQGPWLNLRQGMTGAVLEFQYRATQPQMNVKIGVLEKRDSVGISLEGFIFTVNFHHDFKVEETKERADYINSVGMRRTEFMKFMETLPF